MSESFANAWSQIRTDISTYCLRVAGGDVALATVAFRATAQRVRLGFASLASTDQLYAWSQAVARAEVCRLVYERVTRRQSTRETVLGGTWLQTVLAQALAADWLSVADAELVASGSVRESVDWAAIGQNLSLPAERAAARYTRTLARLWVFLFTQRPDLLGTPDLLRVAFEQARHDPDRPLTPTQADIFAKLVLASPTQDPRRSGWRQELEAACERVIRYIPLP